MNYRTVRLSKASFYVGLGLGVLSGSVAHAEAASAPAAGTKTVNLSRLLGGASVQAIDLKTGLVSPISGMSASIDDDASSGWTPPVGKTSLLLSFPADATISSFTLFAPGAQGRYSLSIAPNQAAITDPDLRTPVLSSAFGVDSAQSVSNVKAKLMVLELDVTEAAPICSIDVVGRPDGQPSGQLKVVAPEAGEQNAGKSTGQVAEVNFAANELGAKVAGSNAGLGSIIDGDTGTSTTLTPVNGKPASASINLAATIDLERVSLAFAEAVGTVSFISTDGSTPDGRLLGEVKLDGKTKTLAIETPGVSAESITILWAPADGSTPLVVSELGAFAMARIVRTSPDPDGSTNITVQPVHSITPPPSTPPVTPPVPVKPPADTPPPIIPPSTQVSH